MSDTQLRYYYGVGRRKSATARAKYYPTDSELEIKVNKKAVKIYFNDFYYQTIATAILNIGIRNGRIEIFVNGGGTMGQAEAARLAIAKAMLAQDAEIRPTLRRFRYLTSDIRKVLPKRPGLRKARKREQWSKR